MQSTPVLSSPPLTDQEVIRAFPRYLGEGSAEHITDFLGVKTRTAFIAGLAHRRNSVEDYPIPANFHATELEWAGVLRAVLAAEKEIVACELGAGWGPWLVTVACAAKLRGIEKISLVGVEASQQHCAYMNAHFADNGVDPRAHQLLHGIVAPRDGVAEFPVLENPAQDWGEAAVNLDKSEAERVIRRILRPVRAAARHLRRRQMRSTAFERLRSYSVATLLKSFGRVDLVHVDIQGDEYEVLRSSRHVIEGKVRRLVIGTHSRQIEEKLFSELAKRNWVLEAEESCRFRQERTQMLLYRDGCQVWRNAALT